MFTVRQALLEDLTQVRDIGIRTYRAHFGELWRYPHELEAFLAEDFSVSALERTLRDPDVCWLLAHEDDALVGYARLNVDSLLAPTEHIGAELQKIYFLPDHAGNGYGQRLYEQVQQRAIDRRQNAVAGSAATQHPRPTFLSASRIEHLWRDLLHQRPGLDRHLVYEQGAVTAPRSAVV